jgi:hypothetical protein
MFVSTLQQLEFLYMEQTADRYYYLWLIEDILVK